MIKKLNNIQQILFEAFEKRVFYARDIYQKITTTNRCTGIVGARGVGKTTYLIHQAIKHGAKTGKAFYISADNIFLANHRLLDIVEQLHLHTEVELLCIDEIHKYQDWNQELKNIFDTFLDLKILFTGSSKIDIIRSKFDLSRRVSLFHLPGLSFREYLSISQRIDLPTLSLEDIIQKQKEITQTHTIPKVLKHFNRYLQIGYYPFFMDFEKTTDIYQAVQNAAQKTIYEDIASLHSLRTSTLLLLERLLKYIIGSQPGELNAYKLSKALGKDFESISEYLRLLEQAGLIRFLYSNQLGKPLLKNPIKMYPDNTNLIEAAYLPKLMDMNTGKSRETFALCQLQNAGYDVFYSKIGDMAVNEYRFEIGGKNKTTQQIKDTPNAYILADGIISTSKNRIPLYLLGFLY